MALLDVSLWVSTRRGFGAAQQETFAVWLEIQGRNRGIPVGIVQLLPLQVVVESAHSLAAYILAKL